MTWNPLLGDITGTSGPIVPSNTIQVKPWGSPSAGARPSRTPRSSPWTSTSTG
jgi:hypothetical protein